MDGRVGGREGGREGGKGGKREGGRGEGGRVGGGKEGGVGGREGWEGLGLRRKKIPGPPVCCSQCQVQPTIEVGLQGLPNMHGFKKLKLTDS